jgi:hypothetical protein
MTRRLSLPLLFLAAFVLAFPIYAFAQATAGAPATDILAAAKSYYLVYGPGLAVLVYAIALLASHIAPTTSKVYSAAQWILSGPVRQIVEKELGVPRAGPTVPPALVALLVGGALLLAAPARAQDVTPAPMKLSLTLGSFKGKPITLTPGLGFSGYGYDFKQKNVLKGITFSELNEIAFGDFPIAAVVGGGFQTGATQGLALQAGAEYRPIHLAVLYSNVIAGSASEGICGGYLVFPL